MARLNLVGILLDVEAAAQEQHEEVEFVGFPVVVGDAGVCPAPEVEQELGQTLDDLADDLEVVKRGDPRQASLSQNASPLQVAQRDRERAEVVKADNDGPCLADSGEVEPGAVTEPQMPAPV